MEMLRADMLAALALQVEWGADEALDDAPIDRTAVVAPPLPQAAPSPASLAGPPRLGAAARAQQEVAGANTLEALYRIVAASRECGLAATATNMALAEGNPEAGLVLVGDVPGAEEDLAGRPFAGQTGTLLDRMLASIGLGRADLLVTNLVPWRPPGGRAPTDGEVQICAAYLWRHLTLLRPRTIVTLGQTPARLLTGKNDTLRRLRGRWQTVSVPGLPAAISVLPTLHPASLLRTPAAKKEAWTDLIALRRHLDALSR